jgi:Spy/CpxP family protein refolding chaperone
MLMVTVIAAGLAGWAGVQYGLRQTRETTDLDTLMHRDLHLNAEQDRQIRALEAGFSSVRAELQTEMRAANRELAEAITQDHTFDPKASQAIARLHAAMSKLQQRTVQHVLAMRAVLTPAQARKFDRKVSEALGVASP